MDTETQDYSSVDEATVIIDNALHEMLKRDLMASAEVRDLLLDIRNIINN
jgi:hypothetical protein